MRVIRLCFLKAVLLLVLCPALLLAAGPQGVRKTLHNLSVEGYRTSPDWTVAGGGQYTETVETQVCIFCHTPHGGDLQGPLWNKDIPVGFESGWTHYNSATLSSAVGSVSRNVSDESLLCLSCHDGTIAIGDIINPSTLGDPSNQAMMIATGPKTNTRIGDAKNLSDDHPISFSYSDVVTAVGTGYGKLKDITYPRDTKGLKFYGTSNRVECGTCHDPHVNYDPYYDPDQDPSACYPSECDATADVSYWPFLRIPNTGSDLCFSCHNK